MPVSLSVHSLTFLSIYPSIIPFVYPLIHHSVCLSVHPCAILTVFLSVFIFLRSSERWMLQTKLQITPQRENLLKVYLNAKCRFGFISCWPSCLKVEKFRCVFFAQITNNRPLGSRILPKAFLNYFFTINFYFYHLIYNHFFTILFVICIYFF